MVKPSPTLKAGQMDLFLILNSILSIFPAFLHEIEENTSHKINPLK